MKNSDTRDDVTIRLEHGQKIIFGANQDRCVIRNEIGELEVAKVADVDESKIVVHDAHHQDPSLAFGLSRLSHPETLQDTPIGVFRDVSRPSYERLMREQLDQTIEKQGAGDLAKLLLGKETWEVN